MKWVSLAQHLAQNKSPRALACAVIPEVKRLRCFYAAWCVAAALSSLSASS